MRNFAVLALCLIFCNTTAQSFNKGYIVDLNGERKDVIILGRKWPMVPAFLVYKSVEDGEKIRISPDSLSAFGSYDGLHFQRVELLLDRASKNLNKMNRSPDPEYVTENNFVRKITDGKISLYKFSDASVTKYFYGDKSYGNLTPLVQKPYLIDQRLFYNNAYIKQLQDLLKCPKISREEMKKAEYTEKSLKALFEAEENCTP